MAGGGAGLAALASRFPYRHSFLCPPPPSPPPPTPHTSRTAPRYLQDFIRQVCKPAYTNVVRERDGPLGIVEFETGDDMERTIRKLDDTEFKNPFDRTYVRIVEDRQGGGGGGGGGGYGGGG